MKVKLAGAAALILVLIIGAGFAVGQKKTSNIPLAVSFVDVYPAHITSDGGGDYVDGIDAVAASLNMDYTHDLVFSIGSRSTRSIHFDFIDPFCAYSNLGSSPGTAVTVYKAGDTPPGGSQWCVANWGTANGRVRFGILSSESYPPFQDTTQVFVSHPDVNTWVVSTTGNFSGTQCQSPEALGDKAALVQLSKRGATSFLGYYHMPFQFTATRKQ